jgi:ribonuclease BN (tRNA processing enzyme)
MRLTILGSGTAIPSGERNSSGYFVETTDLRIMLDCGAGTVPALARYGVDWQRMTHLFISHFHLDHIGELAALFFAFRHGLTEDRQAPLTLVAPRGIEQVLEGLKAAYGEKVFTPKFPLQVRLVEPEEALEIHDRCTLYFAKTPHTTESLALKITDNQHSLGYTGDTAYSAELIRFFQATDLLISECSYLEPRQSPRHLSISEAAKLAEAARVKTLIPTHFYFALPDEELVEILREHFTGEIAVARDGLVIEI